MKLKKDGLLGQLALEKGLVTKEQLAECVREQQILPSDPNMTVGRRSTRPLGTVMLGKGLLTERQLTELLDEQNRRVEAIENFQKVQKIDFLFGQLLVKFNKATQNQINKCLQIQQDLAEKGNAAIPRLGELLVEHGFVDAQTIQEILKLQNKEILYCTNCTKQYNVVGVERGKTYRCKNCGGIMVPKMLLDTLKVDDTQFGEAADDEKPADA